MIIASITRPSGELVISTEPHPRTAAPMIVIAHRRPEIVEVVAALQSAARTLTGRPPQHRTISAAEQIAEDTRLF